jgi:hypothetical protein
MEPKIRAEHSKDKAEQHEAEPTALEISEVETSLGDYNR